MRLLIEFSKLGFHSCLNIKLGKNFSLKDMLLRGQEKKKKSMKEKYTLWHLWSWFMVCKKQTSNLAPFLVSVSLDENSIRVPVS